MNKLFSRKSRGVTLVLNLVALAVFAILGVVVYGAIRSQVREAVYNERLAQAHYIAEAGFEDALHSLYLDPAWRAGFNQKSFAGGYYTVSLSTNTPPVITATGYSANIALLGRAVKTVGATPVFTYTAGGSGSGFAIIGDQLAEVDGPGQVNSYDPTVSLTPSSFNSGAHIWSNKDAKTTAGATVNGNVYYINKNNTVAGTVLGTVIDSTYTLTMPNTTCAACAAANINSTGITPASCYAAGTKDLTAANGVTCSLVSGVYYFRNITVNGTLNVTSTGTVTIYFTGAISMDGTCSVNSSSKIPSRLLFYGGSGTSTNVINSSAPLHAYLEESSGAWNISTPVYGRVWGKNVTVKNVAGAAVHVDLSATTPAGVDWSTGTWRQSYDRP